MTIKFSIIPRFFLLLLLVHASLVSAQTIGHLYVPRPPTGSTFVRIVNPSVLSLTVRVGLGGPQEKLSNASQIATIYRIVRGNEPLRVEINGKPVMETVTPPADKFVTLVVKPKNDQFELKMIVDDA